MFEKIIFSLWNGKHGRITLSLSFFFLLYSHIKITPSAFYVDSNFYYQQKLEQDTATIIPFSLSLNFSQIQMRRNKPLRNILFPPEFISRE